MIRFLYNLLTFVIYFAVLRVSMSWVHDVPAEFEWLAFGLSFAFAAIMSALMDHRNRVEKTDDNKIGGR